MPVEESITTSRNTTLTRNYVGARGIEAMFVSQNGNTTTSYPLYDVHGNMVATVAKGSSGTSWTIQDERSYDVWGSVRSGAATGGPRGRYCANLGHVQDDESGLVYMRARYYEPGSGRFISEDPARDGLKFYVYCKNSPLAFVDSTGTTAESATVTGAALELAGLMAMLTGWVMISSAKPDNVKLITNGLKTMMAGLWMIELGFAMAAGFDGWPAGCTFVMSAWVSSWLTQSVANVAAAKWNPRDGGRIASMALGYGAVLVVFTLMAMYGV